MSMVAMPTARESLAGENGLAAIAAMGLLAGRPVSRASGANFEMTLELPPNTDPGA